jgi:hypothetical protein
MGLEFLRNNGAHRMRDDAMRPLLLDSDTAQNEEPEQDEEQKIDLSFEVPAEQWNAIDCTHTDVPSAWDFRPTRFIDGKDLGRTVAWLQTEEGFPIPVRLSEIGAIVIHNDTGHLRREWYKMERVVSMIVDPFPWDEIESFAAALQEEGFRLLQCQEPRGRLTYDFQEMRKATQNRSMDEMMRLEKQALLRSSDTPILVDGRLGSRTGGFDEMNTPVVGMIKGHHRNYLHPQGWRSYYDLRLGQRTPAFLLKQRNIEVISWYLRLDGTSNDLPNWGIVRLEIPARFFDQKLGRDWSYLNRLSRLICQYRCTDKSYQRASVSLYPIQRAEECLGALFTGAETIINRFYSLTQL